MNKYAISLFIALLTAVCCLAQTRSFKRGVGYNTLMAEDVAILSAGLTWGYNWGHSGSGNESAFAACQVEFVPMAWSGIDKERARNYYRAHPESKYILGFNEPNFNDQAHLTPVEAAAKWPDIEEIADEFNLTIVGPALNYSPNAPYQDPLKWYDEFFQACSGCRVDHIAIHLYMPAMSAIKSNVERFQKYGKPIWLTEFCAWENNTTAASQKRFLIETIDYLEQEPAIFRYAWFKERGWNGGHPYMQLLDNRNEGVFTDLGAVYANMSSYDKNFYHSTETQIQSEHYIAMKGVNMEKTSDVSGLVNFCDFEPADYADYQIDIPETGEYVVSFRLCAEYPDDSEIKLSKDGQEFASLLFEKKGVGVWDTQSLKTTFQQGKQTIRVGFKRGGLKLNWWSISKNEEVSILNTSTENQAIKLFKYYDLTGKPVNEDYKGFVIQKTVYEDGRVANTKYFHQ